MVRYKNPAPDAEDKFFYKVFAFGCVYAILSALVSVGFIAVIIWAIVRVVSQYT